MSDPFFSNVSLLLHLDGTLTDTSNYGHTVTAVGGIALTSSDSKFGSGSITGVHAVGDFLSVPIVASAEMDLSSGVDFTIEFWLKPPSAVVSYIMDITDVTGNAGGFFAQINGNNGFFQLLVDDGISGLNNITPVVVLTTNAWNYVAIVRSGGNLKVYGNGVGNTPINANLMRRGNFFRVGGTSAAIGGPSLGGFMDEIRVTKGVARYLVDFTSPTAPFEETPPGTFGGTVYGKLAPGLVYAPVQAANLGSAHPRIWQPHENLTVKVPK